MDPCGSRGSARTGRRTGSAVGPGSSPGAGHGSTLRPGDSRRSTTEDGRSCPGAAGDGCPVRWSLDQCMRRPLSRSSAVRIGPRRHARAANLSPGSRSGHARHSSRRIGSHPNTYNGSTWHTSTSRTPASPTALTSTAPSRAPSRRCRVTHSSNRDRWRPRRSRFRANRRRRRRWLARRRHSRPRSRVWRDRLKFARRCRLRRPSIGPSWPGMLRRLRRCLW